MTYLANLDFIPEWPERSEAIKANSTRGDVGPGLFGGNKPELSEVVYDSGEKPEFIRQLREVTQRYWPELWNNEVQACHVLRRIQRLLRSFWLAPDQHARDWYIHRARHVVQRFRVQHQLGGEFQRKLETVNDVLDLNTKIDDLLDNPPVHIPFEDALYELQQLKKSKTPLFCPNEKCKKRYFLPERKGTKYCSPECYQADSGRPSKNKSWHAHKSPGTPTRWRKQ